MSREEIQGNSLVSYCKPKKAILKIKTDIFWSHKTIKSDHFFLWGVFVCLTALKLLHRGVVSSIWTQGCWWAAPFKTHKSWHPSDTDSQWGTALPWPSLLPCLLARMLFHKSSVPTQHLLSTFSHKKEHKRAELAKCMLCDKWDMWLSLSQQHQL